MILFELIAHVWAKHLFLICPQNNCYGKLYVLSVCFESTLRYLEEQHDMCGCTWIPWNTSERLHLK